MANPVVHFEVVGKDGATLTKLYGEAFDWEPQDMMEGAHCMVNTEAKEAVPAA